MSSNATTGKDLQIVTGDQRRDPRVLLPRVREVMEHLKPEHRGIFNDFWRTVRETLKGSQDEIDELRSTPSTGGNPISRPSTTASVHRLRAEMDRVMSDEASFVMTTADIEEARGLPQDWLRSFMQGRRTDGGNHPLGCWLSGNVPSHKEYVKVNLRNTKHPLHPGRKIGIQLFAHQLAIVADGRGNQLGATTSGQGYEISHLCHNGACFNPNHLVVEPRGLNQARNSCRGRRIVRYQRDGTVLHPCSHWAWDGGSQRECILPRTDVPPHRAGQWLRAQPDGHFVVRERRP